MRKGQENKALKVYSRKGKRVIQKKKRKERGRKRVSVNGLT